MATPKIVEVRVSRKLSKDYNSTEYSAAVTLELTPAESKVPGKVETLVEEWAENLRNVIRAEFAKSNTRTIQPVATDGALTAITAAKNGANGHAH